MMVAETQPQNQAVEESKPEATPQAGEVKVEETGTATVEEKQTTDDTGLQKKVGDTGVSIEDIMSKEPPTTEKQLKGLKAEGGTHPWFQRRMNQMTEEKKALQTENEKLKSQLASPKDRPVAPDRDQFETAKDWQAAMDKYIESSNAYHQAQNATRAETSNRARQDQENANRFVQQAEELKARFPDIYQTIDSTNYGNARDSIANSKHSARIGLYLAYNPAELARLNSLSSQSAVDQEIGGLAARFDNVQTTTTQAPAPITPVKGEGETAITPMDEIKDDNEWFKRYEADRLRKLKEQFKET